MFNIRIFISLTLLFFVNCNAKNNNIIDAFKHCYPKIYSKVNSSLEINSFEYILINPSLNYPVHSYIEIQSNDGANILEFIKDINLMIKDTINILKNSDTNNFVQPYNYEKLWDLYGLEIIPKDTIYINNNLIVNSKIYAGYWNRNGFVSQKFNSENMSGKIVAIVNNDKCVLFIEELVSPQFLGRY